MLLFSTIVSSLVLVVSLLGSLVTSRSGARLSPRTSVALGSHYDCYEVELQVSFDTHAAGICLADRWRHTMQRNVTYQSIAMSSLDECSFGITMYGNDNPALHVHSCRHREFRRCDELPLHWSGGSFL